MCILYPIIFIAICNLFGIGAFKLAEFYQSIDIINQVYNLQMMDECIIRYGAYCFGIFIIILYIRLTW